MYLCEHLYKVFGPLSSSNYTNKKFLLFLKKKRKLWKFSIFFFRKKEAKNGRATSYDIIKFCGVPLTRFLAASSQLRCSTPRYTLLTLLVGRLNTDYV